MQLKEFSFISPVIESGEVLKAIETAIPSEAIEQVLGSTESWEERVSQTPVASSSRSCAFLGGITRLITSLLDIALFPALLLACEYHQRWEIENTIDQLLTHLLGRKTPIRTARSSRGRSRSLRLVAWTLGCRVLNVSSGTASRSISTAPRFYRNTQGASYCNSSVSGCSS